MGFYSKVRSAKTFPKAMEVPKATWSARKGKTVVLVSLAWGGMGNKDAPECVV